MKEPNVVMVSAFVLVAFAFAIGGYVVALGAQNISDAAATGVIFGIFAGTTLACMLGYLMNILIQNIGGK
jgi:hypothetical protein